MDKRGIVNILNSRMCSIGTGFFVSSSGYIITCYHVLSGNIDSSKGIAFRNDGMEAVHYARFISKDEENDIAVMQTDLKPDMYYILKVRGQKYEKLATLGFPNGSMWGILCEPVIQDYIKGEKYIQLKNANAITYGFSGAPLIAGDGTVVGMAAGIMKDDMLRMQDIALAIPSKLIIEAFSNYIDCVKREEMPKEEELKRNEELPSILTKSVVAYADEDNVIHRRKELQKLEQLLTIKKKPLLLSGFGGIGKTSLARVLYFKLSPYYDSVGWVEYHSNLKMSLLASIDLFEDIADQGKRWEMLLRKLKNDSTKKLLFIDNVDRDSEQDQDPLTDKLIIDISGWRNMTVVLTSRLDGFQGYTCYKVDYIGKKERQKIWCVDLFYFFYNKEEYLKKPGKRIYSQAVYQLVELAGYHTYAIELLAKSAKYELSLNDYVKKVRKCGFRFSSLNIHMGDGENCATAAEQLRKLFNMRTRTAKEIRILWDFSILPNIILSSNEVECWLGYHVNDLDSLVNEGWLLFQGGFYMHPLIRETILLDLKEGKAPIGTASKLIEHLKDNNFVAKGEAYTVAIRKLNIVENVLKFVPIEENAVSARIYNNVGHYFFARIRRRLTAVLYYQKALQIYQKLETTAPGTYMEEIAAVSYRLGYVESATSGYRKDCEVHLRETLRIRRGQEADHPGEHLAELARVCDHLGYVLSDNEEYREEAKSLLLEALSIWKKLGAGCAPKYEASIATTCDNLGRLLSICNDKAEAEMFLNEALEIRRRLSYEKPGKHITEVAWTCHNLGDLLSSDIARRSDAERFYYEALEIRRRLENENPCMYAGNIAWTCTSLAKLLSTDENRLDEVKDLCCEALEMRKKLDSEHLGFLIDDASKECEELLDLVLQKKCIKS